jgi:hypothetical protein
MQESNESMFLRLFGAIDTHSFDKPFCYEPTCSCHDDDVLIVRVWLWVQDGLMTPDEATDFVKGKGI